MAAARHQRGARIRAVLLGTIAGMIAAAGSFAASDSAALGSSSSGLHLVGSIPVWPCDPTNTVAAVDPALGVLVMYYAKGVSDCAAVGSKDPYLVVEAYSTHTLKRLARKLVVAPGYHAYVSPVRTMALDPVRHWLFLTLPYGVSPDAGTHVLAVSLADILGPSSTVGIVGDYAVPQSSFAAATSNPASAQNVITPQDPTAVASGYAIAPTSAYYDAASSSLFLLESMNYGNAPSASARGPFAQDMYITKISVPTGNVAWTVSLGQCSFSPSQSTSVYAMSLADPLMVTHAGSGTTVYAGCVFSRGPALFSPAGTSGLLSQQVQSVGGSMLTYAVPLDRAGQPLTGQMSYAIGRPNVFTGLADADSGRIFWAASPPQFAGTSSGPTAVVYDAAHTSYVAAPTAGSADDVRGYFAFAAGGGRFYSAGRGGITVLDARATPPGQGVVDSSYSCPTERAAVDSRARRVFIRPYSRCNATASSGNAPATRMLVYQDDLPAIEPPPPPDPDSYTQQIDEKTGVTNTQLSGSGAATGTRLRLVGGPKGLVSGGSAGIYDLISQQLSANGVDIEALLQQQGFVIDPASREVSFGAVRQVSVDNYQAGANASIAVADDATVKNIATNSSGQLSWPFKEVHCTDPGSKTGGEDVGLESATTVGCDQSAHAAHATSSAGPLGLSLALVAGKGNPAAGTSLPLGVAQSVAGSHVWLDASKGLESDSTAVVHGLNLGVATIESIETELICHAHGRSHTASCTYTRKLLGVKSGGAALGPGGCIETDGPTGRLNSCGSLLAALNALQPGQLTFAMPDPDQRVDNLAGSPGGYQAVGQREFYEHLQDDILNYDSSTQVAGLEVTYLNDSFSAPSRLNVQLANVQAESHYGITEPGPEAPIDLGSLTTILAPPVIGTEFEPPAATNRGSKGSGVLGTIVTQIRRAFAGLSFAWRSPLLTLTVAALLVLLTGPFFLAWRRGRLLAALKLGDR